MGIGPPVVAGGWVSRGGGSVAAAPLAPEQHLHGCDGHEVVGEEADDAQLGKVDQELLDAVAGSEGFHGWRGRGSSERPPAASGCWCRGLVSEPEEALQGEVFGGDRLDSIVAAPGGAEEHEFHQLLEGEGLEVVVIGDLVVHLDDALSRQEVPGSR